MAGQKSGWLTLKIQKAPNQIPTSLLRVFKRIDYHAVEYDPGRKAFQKTYP